MQTTDFNLAAALRGEPFCGQQGVPPLAWDWAEKTNVLIVKWCEGDFVSWYTPKEFRQLRMIVQPKKVWVNVYHGAHHLTEQEAKERIMSGYSYIETICIEE